MEFHHLGEKGHEEDLCLNILKMTSAQDAQISVNTKSPSQCSFNPDEQITLRYLNPGFKPFSSLSSEPARSFFYKNM